MTDHARVATPLRPDEWAARPKIAQSFHQSTEGASEEILLRQIATQLGLQFCSTLPLAIHPDVLAHVSHNEALTWKIIPIGYDKQQKILTVAVADPLNIQITDDLARKTQCTIAIVVAPEETIINSIERSYASSDTTPQQALDKLSVTPFSTPVDERCIDLDTPDHHQNPMVNFVHIFLRGAIRAGASDILIQPFDDRELVVRTKIDGQFRTMDPPLPLPWHPGIISQLKVAAGIDISEKRLPQDGHIHIKLQNTEYHLRVATAPQIHGELMVLRIIDPRNGKKTIDQIGLSALCLEKIHLLLRQPHGIIFITGKTGCGKTTTLCALMSALNQPSRNIITIEDPVEYILPGINQIPVNHKQGLGFSQILRSVLRLAPDVILVGETRDSETAATAMAAAQTGHLVLSTLHTNDATASITRLRELGVENFVISDVLRGVLSQRLLPLLCSNCAQQTSLDPELQFQLTLTTSVDLSGIRAPLGCALCDETGYRGRMPIHELLTLTGQEAKSVISRNLPALDLREIAHAQGELIPFRNDVIQKMLHGKIPPVLAAIALDELRY